MAIRACLLMRLQVWRSYEFNWEVNMTIERLMNGKLLVRGDDARQQARARLLANQRTDIDDLRAQAGQLAERVARLEAILADLLESGGERSA